MCLSLQVGGSLLSRYEEYNIWASDAIRQRLTITVNKAKDVIESIKKKKIIDKIKDLNKDFEN